MPLMFNTILKETGISLRNIRLIRHKDKSALKGYSPYELWRDDKQAFEFYQSVQSLKNRPKFLAPYWAVFVVNSLDESIFAGIYSANLLGPSNKELCMPHNKSVYPAGTCDTYDINLQNTLSDLIGKLIIDWGAGALAWVQYADKNDKRVIQILKEFKEPDFPGFLNFVQPLSKLEKLPKTWEIPLKSTRGVYLLTCPKTKEQYVGSAHGQDGFWGRWQDYVKNGHGGNIGLRSKESSDYQISILEVAGTAATEADIYKMEGLWQAKLQSMEMGLNKNKAGSLVYC